MGLPGKHFSKNDRKRKGVHVCSCGTPLSGSRIKKGIILCLRCAARKKGRVI
jgi:ribosomal protein L37AE/L43A